MLPASQTTQSPSRRKISLDNRALLGGAIGLALYCWVLGLCFLFGWIGIANAYLLMALPCLVLIGWYAYGFLKVADVEQDFGLLLSAVGWASILVALLIRHSAESAAQAFIARTGMYIVADPTPGATVCIFLGIVFLALGAYLSWDAWQRDQRANGNL